MRYAQATTTVRDHSETSATTYSNATKRMSTRSVSIMQTIVDEYMPREIFFFLYFK